jgi:quercetin dioxygenase-like cupin family protein
MIADATDAVQFPVFYVVGQTYVKQLELKSVGDKVLSHEHDYDHLSLLAKGRVRVTVEGIAVDYTSPCGVVIAAGKAHEIEALVSGCLWYCIHSVPEGLRGEELLDAAVVSKQGQVTPL